MDENYSDVPSQDIDPNLVSGYEQALSDGYGVGSTIPSMYYDYMKNLPDLRPNKRQVQQYWLSQFLGGIPKEGGLTQAWRGEGEFKNGMAEPGSRNWLEQNRTGTSFIPYDYSYDFGVAWPIAYGVDLAFNG